MGLLFKLLDERGQNRLKVRRGGNLQRAVLLGVGREANLEGGNQEDQKPAAFKHEAPSLQST
jgi:hypothetical protein